MAPDPTEPSKKRPVVLAIALIAMSLVGLDTLSEGWFSVEVVRDPFAIEAGLEETASVQEAARRAFAAALAAQPDVSLPLGLAQLLLGGLLLFVSFRALFSRTGSTSFALQVVLANIALLVVGYVLRQPVRVATVDALVASGAAPPEGTSIEEMQQLVRLQGWWAFRVKLGIEVLSLALSGFALTRRSVREALAPAEPTSEEG